MEEGKKIIADMFHGTAERDPQCGDGLKIIVLDNTGKAQEEVIPLRSD